MIIHYSHKCKYCKKEKPHRVYRISRQRGFKLQCLVCGFVTPKYVRANKLITYKEANFPDEDNKKEAL